MKKTLLFILLSACSVVMASCDGDSSSSSSIAIENPTEVIVSGPKSTYIDQTIPLSATVVGSSDHSVTWAVDDQTIASIDDSGRLTGLKEGTVNVSATSKKYPSLVGTYSVNVIARLADGVELIVDSEEAYVGENGVYYIPLGIKIHLSYRLDDEKARSIDGISYAFVSNEGEDTSSLGSFEVLGDNTVNFVAMSVFENVAIRVSIFYDGFYSASATHSLIFTSVDNNADNKVKVAEIIENISNKETDLSSANFAYGQAKDELSETTYQIYNDGASSHTIYSDDTTKDSVSIIDNSSIYYFDYDVTSGDILNVYQNLTYDNENAAIYEANARRAHFYLDNNVYYGFASLFELVTSGSSYRGYDVFGSFYLGAYAQYSFNEANSLNVLSITSEYYDNLTNAGYSAAFTLSYSDDYSLESYSYEIYDYDGVNKNLLFVESADEFVYGEKTNFTSFDIEKYYYSTIVLEELAGKKADDGSYDYTDLERYGADEVGVEDGLTMYTLSYDKALPLIIDGNASLPTTATPLIDNISALSTYSYTDESGATINMERSFFSYENGSFSISAPKYDSGNSIATKERVTISGRGGASTSFLIQWTVPNLKGITFSSSENVSNNVFPSIRAYGRTGYFYLNPNPDDVNLYTFAIDIHSKPTNGDLSLHQYSDNNQYSNPDGSYYLTASVPGTYKFSFYIIEADYIKTEEFTLTVEELLSASEIEEKIIGETYIYNTGMTEFRVTFTNASTITLVEEQYMMGNAPIEDTIPYKISDGRITIEGNFDVNKEDTGVNFSYYKFDTEGFYYDAVLAGDIDFNNDLSQITLYLRSKQDLGDGGLDFDDDELVNFAPTSFNIYQGLESLNGINVKSNGSSYANTDYGMVEASIVFDESFMTLTLTSLKTNAVVDIIRAGYEFDDLNKIITFSNVVSINNIVAFNYLEYNRTSSSWRASITFPNSYSATYFDFTF